MITTQKVGPVVLVYDGKQVVDVVGPDVVMTVNGKELESAVETIVGLRRSEIQGKMNQLGGQLYYLLDQHKSLRRKLACVGEEGVTLGALQEAQDTLAMVAGLQTKAGDSLNQGAEDRRGYGELNQEDKENWDQEIEDKKKRRWAHRSKKEIEGLVKCGKCESEVIDGVCACSTL